MEQMNLHNIFRLLDIADREVSGRQPATPPDPIKLQIENLIEGSLDEKSRHTLCESLKNQPDWLAWMAESIKTRRNSADRSPA